eukprot:1195786-Prorocentrum_minimum.AAC.2
MCSFRSSLTSQRSKKNTMTGGRAGGVRCKQRAGQLGSGSGPGFRPLIQLLFFEWDFPAV